MSSQDNLASIAQTSHLESRELLLEQSLAGSASLQILAQAQEFLSSNPAECNELPSYIAAIHASISLSGTDSGIAYAANATAGEAPEAASFTSPARGDNLTIVAPF